MFKKCLFTVDLYQPHSVTYTPEPRDDEEEDFIVRRRGPSEETDENGHVQQERAAHDGHATRQLHDVAGRDGRHGVGYPVADHHIADVGDAPSTCDVGLEKTESAPVWK